MLTGNIYTSEKITDIITRIAMPGNVFAYLAEGSERAAVIDTGFGLGPFREYVEEKLRGKPYDLILTHGHLDHAGGAAQFDQVYMNLRDLEVARAHTEKKLRAGFMKGSGLEFEDSDLADQKGEGYTPLQYGQKFDLGNEVL